MRVFQRRRGAALYLMAASLVMVSGLAALVVDISSALLSRTRQQAAADSAALAACNYLVSPVDEIAARNEALYWAHENGFNINADDVSFFTRPDGKTAVTVSWHQLVPTTFARIFGLNDIEVAVDASAVPGAVKAIPIGLIPIGLVSEQTTDSTGNLVWQVLSGVNPDQFVAAQAGTPVVLKLGAGCANNGNFAGLAIDGNGAEVYRHSITYGASTQLTANQWVQTEPGNMVGPTEQGFAERQKLYGGNTTDDHWRDVYIPLISKTDWDNLNGKGQVRVIGFATARVTQVDDNKGEVDATLINTAAPGQGDPTGPGVGATSYAPVLIPTPQT